MFAFQFFRQSKPRGAKALVTLPSAKHVYYTLCLKRARVNEYVQNLVKLNIFITLHKIYI